MRSTPNRAGLRSIVGCWFLRPHCRLVWGRLLDGSAWRSGPKWEPGNHRLPYKCDTTNGVPMPSHWHTLDGLRVRLLEQKALERPGLWSASNLPWRLPCNLGPLNTRWRAFHVSAARSDNSTSSRNDLSLRPNRNLTCLFHSNRSRGSSSGDS